MENRKEDIKIFFKYIFNPRGLLEGFVDLIRELCEPRRFSIFVLLASLVFFIFSPRPNNYYLAIIFMVIFLFLHLKIRYSSGDHRHWYRNNLGIKSKKELLRTEKYESE